MYNIRHSARAQKSRPQGRSRLLLDSIQRSVPPEQEEVHEVADLDFTIAIEVRTNVVATCVVVDVRKAVVVQGLHIRAACEQAMPLSCPALTSKLRAPGAAARHTTCRVPRSRAWLLNAAARSSSSVNGSTTCEPIHVTPPHEGLPENRLAGTASGPRLGPHHRC